MEENFVRLHSAGSGQQYRVRLLLHAREGGEAVEQVALGQAALAPATAAKVLQLSYQIVIENKLTALCSLTKISSMKQSELCYDND